MSFHPLRYVNIYRVERETSTQRGNICFYAPLTLALSNPFSVVPQHPVRTLYQSSCHKLTKNPILTPICL